VLETDTVNVDQYNQVRLGLGSRKIKFVPDITLSKNKIVLLGSSHARKTGPTLGATLGKKFDVFSILKPNAPLTNVIEDLGKLSKNFTKQDHSVIMGGPGNRLDRN
jgi:hypothetical protein